MDVYSTGKHSIIENSIAISLNMNIVYTDFSN